MSDNNSYQVRWAVGSGRNFAKAQNKVGTWASLVRLLDTPTATRESRKQFDRMTKTEQDNLKSIDGWISGAPCEGKWRNKANIQDRDLLTLDIDYAEVSLPDRLEAGLTGLSDLEFYVHSSRRHTSEMPRLRMIIPMSRLVAKEDYGPLVRIVSWLLDDKRQPIQQVDQVSARMAQMMFLPTISKDGEWFSYRNEGALLDPDKVFSLFKREVGDWHDLSLLPLYDGERELREGADKAEDPTTKKGLVGDFCRAYDVESAMETFLPGVYEPSDEASGKPRYTYAGSTSSNGAVVEDGGLFLYSHHGSDPVCDQLVNAYDLVRIHMFGEEDQGISPDTPMSSRPSWKAMVSHISDDDEFKKAQAESKYDLTAMFEDVSDGFYDEEEEEEFEDHSEEDDLSDVLGDPPPEERPKPKKRKAPKGWFPSELELDQHGQIKGSLHNASVIVHNDARLYECIAFNDLSKQLVLKRSIQSNIQTVPSCLCRNPADGDRWQDINDISVRALLEAPNGEGKAGYGMKVTDRDLVGAISLAAQRNKFHPVKQYLESLEWDGTRRVDTMLMDFMGSSDSIYIREVSRTIMVASVTRIYEPGHKFDFAPIIEGKQGIRKSTFISELYGHDWFGEIDCRLDDKQRIAEAIQGIWVGELPELSSFHKSDHNDAKAFMRRQHDDVRMAYERRVNEFPRQCVFWGSTNDDKYLKDPTGNRSYWPVDASSKSKADPIDVDALVDMRDQLWAEAVAAYREMRKAQPRGTLKLALSQESENIAEELQEAARTSELHEEWAESIRDWADEPIRLSQLYAEYGLVSEQFPDEDGKDPDEIWVVRNVWRPGDVMVHALGLQEVTTTYQQKQTSERAYGILDEWERIGKNSVRRFGLKARWYQRVGTSERELYTEVEAPVAYEDDVNDVL